MTEHREVWRKFVAIIALTVLFTTGHEEEDEEISNK